ncbi:hypothetical protein D5086_031194 [Populus alba]|uniref:Uncharacterized protein n=1 Tax=Populus alba TaxID=43335 RepID=A0ACC4AQL3_POPAL
MRRNSEKWMKLAKTAVDEGGSSDKNITEFAAELAMKFHETKDSKVGYYPDNSRKEFEGKLFYISLSSVALASSVQLPNLTLSSTRIFPSVRFKMI